MRFAIIALLLLPSHTLAGTIIATKNLRANYVIKPEDVTTKPERTIGMLEHPSDAIGKELKATVYAGKPISTQNIQAPTVIERNQIVKLKYTKSGLTIETNGRALERASSGSFLRVINLQSKSTIIGIAHPDGSVSLSEDN